MLQLWPPCMIGLALGTASGFVASCCDASVSLQYAAAAIAGVSGDRLFEYYRSKNRNQKNG